MSIDGHMKCSEVLSGELFMKVVEKGDTVDTVENEEYFYCLCFRLISVSLSCPYFVILCAFFSLIRFY